MLIDRARMGVDEWLKLSRDERCRHRSSSGRNSTLREIGIVLRTASATKMDASAMSVAYSSSEMLVTSKTAAAKSSVASWNGPNVMPGHTSNS